MSNVHNAQSKENYPHAGNDCVLMVKHLVNSESLSQKPLVFLPASFEGLVKQPLQALPRNLIQERAKKELLASKNKFCLLPFEHVGLNLEALTD